MSVERFFIKRASLAAILPAVAGPALGGFAGKALGPRIGLSPDVGALLGGVTGGVTGGLLREKAEQAENVHAVPPGAPYSLDATMADIPPWALAGARMVSPKMAGHFGDIVGGDLGGLAWPVVEGIRGKQTGGEIARNMAGQGLGTLGGGLVGHGVGHVIDKLVGHPVAGPLGVPLSTLLAGLGATIGNVKGLDIARGKGA